MKYTICSLVPFLLFLCCPFGSIGQQLNTPVAVHQNFSLINPAFLGSAPASGILLSYRKQWSGLPNAPELISGLADLRFLGGKSGIGIEGNVNNVGMINRSSFGIGYAYRLKFNDNNHLGFGLSAGMEKTSIDFSRILADDPAELVELQQFQGNTIGKFSVGIMYQLKQWQIGLNAQLYTGNRMHFDNPVSQTSIYVNKVPNYSLVTRWPIALSKRWIYTPSVVLLSTQGLPVYIDNLHQFTFDDQIQVGLGYRQATNVYLQAGYTFYSQIYISYVYQRNVSGIGSQLQNTHELLLKFTLNKENGAASSAGQGKVRHAEVLQEQIDNNEARLRQLQSHMDSLESTIDYQKKEIEMLKNEQVTMEELKQVVKEINPGADDSLGTNIKLTSYEVINVMNERDIQLLEDEPNSHYYIVLGAFRNMDKAKDLRKILKRDLDMDLRLISMESNSKTMYLVTQPKEYASIKEASGDLLKLKRTRKTQYESYLNGEPWLLKMKK
jgi:type IX secretion system PorP/SprF family membrane protein